MTCLIDKNVIHLCPFTFYSLEVSATLNISSEKWHFLSLDVSIDSVYVKWNLTSISCSCISGLFGILTLSLVTKATFIVVYGDFLGLRQQTPRSRVTTGLARKWSIFLLKHRKCWSAWSCRFNICRVYLQKAGINRVYDLCSIVLQRAKIYFISKNSKAIQFQC